MTREQEHAWLLKEMGLSPDPGQQPNNRVLAYEEGSTLVFNMYATKADAEAHMAEVDAQRTSLRREGFRGDLTTEATRRVLATNTRQVGSR